MNRIRERKFWVVLVAVLLLFAACKGESPTAPPPGGGAPPGSQPPPSGVSLGLTTSNAEPLVDSTVVVTATVTQDGQPVPNGTAVEFRSTSGSLDGGGTSTIKTTTNGIATATLTSTTPGPVRITATVTNVTRTVDVTFRPRPTDPPPAGGAPTITSITPSIGRPAGGEVIRITGTNFHQPVRVLFDVGRPLPVEAFVVSVSETAIEVITPQVDLGSGQQLESRVIVITRAGTTSEQRVEAIAGFTFRNERLEPRISTASPNSGPVTGGTIVTIFGDGFQAPVQVLFGSAEARVINIQFSQILVESPAGRDTAPGGSGTVTGPVDITVRNINSQTFAVATGGFRYVAAMQITAAGPTEGPASGGTRVTIDGIGFVAPVAVTIGGVAAQPIDVSGTRIVALTSPVTLVNCAAPGGGNITVTNIVNGDTAAGPLFTYRVFQPVVIGVTPTQVTAGGNVTVRVANPQPGITRIRLGDKTVFPTSTTLNPDGTASYVVPVPTTFEFPTETCIGAGGVQGTRLAPMSVNVTYTNVESGCTDTADDALTVLPTNTVCEVPPTPPPPIAVVISPSSGCAQAGSVTVGSSGTATITFRNAGGEPLTVQSTGTTNPAEFTVTPAEPVTIAPNQIASFTVTFTPTAAGARTGNATFVTNDPSRSSMSVCLQGTGVAP
jgi:hypothetical protein